MGEYALPSFDTTNKEINEEYANKVIEAFRKQIGWRVKPNTRIHTELREFSRGYSKIGREPLEVVIIFCAANDILK